MNATQSASRRTSARKPRTAASRPVTELLLEITYHLHATKVVSRPRAPRSK
jgi:hypothetical protein